MRKNVLCIFLAFSSICSLGQKSEGSVLSKYLEAAKDDNFIDPFTGKKPSEEAISAATNARDLFTAEIFRKKSQLTSMYAQKKVSASTFNYLQYVIKKAENEDVSLPTPNPSDK